MAISLALLQEKLVNPNLTDLEQFMLDFFEAQFDKEIYLLFVGGAVNFKKSVYFTQPLRAAHINSARDTIIYNLLVTMYDTAGWTLTTATNIGGEQMTFTPKTT
jgi:hypothetical protein